MTQLRIGVICEGPTDFHAIRHFMAPALDQHGVKASFIDIQPDMGRTLPEGGWGNVELWLKNNPPKLRIQSYFDGGLFQRNLSSKACDLFLLQMDSDILDDESFISHMRNDYGIEIAKILDHVERGRRISDVLKLWSNVKALTQVDSRRHVFVPAVESTETWCVAAFDNKHQEPENLRGADLAQAFMEALEQSESRPIQVYTTVSKDVERRARFCETHAAGHSRIVERCPHFNSAVTAILKITRPEGKAT
ncbi:MAG: hypothetical protein WCC64_22410 [Aliidongia sp.]